MNSPNFAAWPEPPTQPEDALPERAVGRLFASKFDKHLTEGREQVIDTLLSKRETFAGFASSGRAHDYTPTDLHEDLTSELPEEFSAWMCALVLTGNEALRQQLKAALEKRLDEFLRHHAELRAELDATLETLQ